MLDEEAEAKADDERQLEQIHQSIAKADAYRSVSSKNGTNMNGGAHDEDSAGDADGESQADGEDGIDEDGDVDMA